MKIKRQIKPQFFIFFRLQTPQVPRYTGRNESNFNKSQRKRKVDRRVKMMHWKMAKKQDPCFQKCLWPARVAMLPTSCRCAGMFLEWWFLARKLNNFTKQSGQFSLYARFPHAPYQTSGIKGNHFNSHLPNVLKCLYPPRPSRSSAVDVLELEERFHHSHAIVFLLSDKYVVGAEIKELEGSRDSFGSLLYLTARKILIWKRYLSIPWPVSLYH